MKRTHTAYIQVWRPIKYAGRPPYVQIEIISRIASRTDESESQALKLYAVAHPLFRAANK